MKNLHYSSGPGHLARAALLLLSLSFLTLLPGLAQAQAQLGIYFDQAYTQTSLAAPDLPTVVTGYLVLKNPEPGLAVRGWECCVRVNGPGEFLGWALEGQPINVEQPPCFYVGLGGDGLPLGNEVLLATFQMRVTLATAVVLSLEPVYDATLPGSMAYICGPGEGQVLPMETPTGMAQVAFINQDMPWPEITPNELDFETVVLGASLQRSLTVRNVGGGILNLDINIPEDPSDFALTTVSGSHYLLEGQSLTIPVVFEPTQLGNTAGTLILSPEIPGVPLSGYCREPNTAYTLYGSMDFHDLRLGEQEVRSLNIHNIGEADILVEPSLDPLCENFTILLPGPMVLPAGHIASLPVRFQPQSVGEFTCVMHLGEIVQDVTMTGTCHEAVTSWTVDPLSLDFGDLAVGSLSSRLINISNTGETTLSLNLVAVGDDIAFTLPEVSGVRDLPPGQTLHVTVAFSPPAEGYFSGEIQLGGPLPNIPVIGTGVEPNPACLVDPLSINFGTTQTGSGIHRYFRVENIGNVGLTVSPSETSDHFWVSTSSFLLQPGQTRDVLVVFAPLATGTWSCDVSLGGSNCQPVHCEGTSTYSPPPVGENAVGIFFDSYYGQNDVYTPQVGVQEAYLVLKNVSDPLGVYGWECRHVLDSTGIFFLQAILNGTAINVAQAPDFMVGLYEPLPAGPDVLLATLSYLVAEPYSEARLLLYPMPDSSLPGSMAFAAGSNPELLLPMNSVTGSNVVAYMNVSMVDATPPAAPALTASGNQVRLTWDVPGEDYQSFHVFRREGTGQDTRLTMTPQPLNGGQVRFTDTPEGFATGEVLYYSYSLVKNGLEGPRSREVEYTFQPPVVQATRLLPNVPNPFNPQTRIIFALAQDGPCRVAIYDVSGRLIRQLESSNLEMGQHERVWLGRDDAGRPVPSGAYYVRLVTPDGVDSRKVMLLK